MRPYARRAHAAAAAADTGPKAETARSERRPARGRKLYKPLLLPNYFPFFLLPHSRFLSPLIPDVCNIYDPPLGGSIINILFFGYFLFLFCLLILYFVCLFKRHLVVFYIEHGFMRCTLLVRAFPFNLRGS
jgi:hypothetical protein